MIEDRAARALLGVVSLHRIDWTRRCAGLGYWIRRASQRKGYATEAVGRLIDHAFQELGMHRLEAHIGLENRASQRVVEKLGLLREGVARGVEFVDGRYLDHVQYGLLRTDPRGESTE